MAGVNYRKIGLCVLPWLLGVGAAHPFHKTTAVPKQPEKSFLLLRAKRYMIFLSFGPKTLIFAKHISEEV